MNKWAVIGTWSMSFEGVRLAAEMLAAGRTAADAAEAAVIVTEDKSAFTSVGYGGLPNSAGIVELDAGYMDGDTLEVGAVGAIRDYKNPVAIARMLSHENNCNLLVAGGAEEYAHRNMFKRKNMLAPKALAAWRKQAAISTAHTPGPTSGAGKPAKNKNDGPGKGAADILPADANHDTVCVVALDIYGSIVVATSTSGIFMKPPGRVGDTPLAGSGFYADSRFGGAAATGFGEDIMRGCLSYETVRRMASGMPPEEAATGCVGEHADILRSVERRVVSANHKNGGAAKNAGAANAPHAEDRELRMSVICVDVNGRFGAATSAKFQYTAAASAISGGAVKEYEI